MWEFEQKLIGGVVCGNLNKNSSRVGLFWALSGSFFGQKKIFQEIIRVFNFKNLSIVLNLSLS